MEKIKTKNEIISISEATVAAYSNSPVWYRQDIEKYMESYASQYKKRVDELESVVSDLAQFALNQKRLVSRVGKIGR